MQETHKRLLGWLLVGAIPAGMAIMNAKYQSNSAETSPTHPDPQLRTRYYLVQNSLNDFTKQIESIIPQLTNYGRRWRLISNPDSIQEAGTRIIRAEVPVFFFTDDLEVRLRISESGRGVVVDIRSAARVGKSDLGENRRHVLQLLEELDKRLGGS